ncbi:MAG: hypothetical protein PWQ06_327 [Anaerophaga sp.]|nr:hypothetical protein [Anaerophaga sp.]
MKNFLLFIAALFLVHYASAQIRSVPMTADNFSVVYSGPVTEEVDGLRIPTVGYRNGNLIFVKDAFNAVGTPIKFKWYITNDGSYIRGGIKLAQTVVSTNDISLLRGIHLNQWLYTTITVGADYNFSVVTCSGDYNGTVVDSNSGTVTDPTEQSVLENTTLKFYFWDTQDATASLKIGELIIPDHSPKQMWEVSNVDFEDQTIPSDVIVSGSISNVAADGANSSYSLYMDGSPGEYIEFQVTDPDVDMLTFNVKINHSESYRIRALVGGVIRFAVDVYYAGSTSYAEEWCEVAVPVVGGADVRLNFDDYSNQDIYIDNIRQYVLNAQPAGLTLDNNTVDENSPSGTVVGAFSATDADSDPLIFSLTENAATDNDLFVINGTSLETASVFDYETANQYQIEVKVSDGISEPVTEMMTIDVNDVNEAPLVEAGQTLDFDEESPAGTSIGLVTATDEDATDNAPVFSIQSGNEDGYFNLDAATGELTLLQAGLNRYDYESFSLLIRATDEHDALLYTEETVAVNVGEIPFSGGAGTEADPFQIKTPKDLDEIRNYLGSSHADKYFALVNDIDLQVYLSEGNPGYNNGLFWERLGYYEYFEGHLNGNNFSVLNLKINRPDDYINGLFGYVNSAEIINLNVSVDPFAEIVGKSGTAILAGSVFGGSIISNVHVSGKVNAEPGNVGGLAGSFTNGSVISDCSATVEVVSTGNAVGGLIGANNGTILRCHVEGAVTGGEFVGGIAGINDEEPVQGARGMIQQCSVDENTVVTATTGECGGLVGQNTGDITRCSSFATVNAPLNAGGLVGNNKEVEADMMMVFENYAGRINNSYASGMVTATDGAAGGLVGQNTGDIENCYALGEVNAPLNAGGLVGENLEIAEENTEGGLITGTITNCYSATLVNGSDATIGGFAGVNDGNITSSYWDINASGQENSAGGTGLNGIAMREAASFVDWDFTNTWGIDALAEYVSYPYLTNNEETPHPGAIGKVTVTSWPVASDIVYGQTVGESVLSGGEATHEGSPVTGTFYFAFAGNLPVAGTYEEEVVFTPDDSESYLPVPGGTTSVVVSPKPVSVVNAMAQDKSYDGTTNAVVSGAVLEANAVEGDDDVVLSNHTYGTFAQADAGVGITVTTNMTLTGADAINYSLEQPVLSASITKAMVTATADDKSRLYGDANPNLTVSYSGFVNGENASVLDLLPVISTLATANSIVGDYAITVGDGYDGNYDFSYVNGLLSVNPAPLTVKAKDASRVAGMPNPEFELEYTGFVNGEDQSEIDFLPVASCDADEFSVPGDYTINVSGGDDGNYYFIYDNSGILTVTVATHALQQKDVTASVYPVPADDFVFVECDGAFVKNIQLLNMTGTVEDCSVRKVSDDLFRIDIQKMQSGIYFLMISQEQNIIVKKIIVK